MGWQPVAASLLVAAVFASSGTHAFVLNDPVTRRPAGEYTINTQITHSTLGTTSPTGGSWNDGFLDALDAWNNAAGLGTLVDLNANVGVFEDPCEVADDGVHGVGFSSTFCGVPWGGTTLAIAVRSFSPGGLVSDGNIVFRDDPNADWDIVSGAQMGFDDFRRVAVHELGHLLGLDHPPGNNAIMFMTVQDNVEVPQADDIAGIVELYDLTCPGLIPSGAGTIDGSIDATDCLDTDIGLMPPGSLGNCTQLTFEDSFIDLYQVNLPSGASLDVTLDSSDFNPTIQVFDNTLSTELGCAWSNFSTPALLTLPLSPGAYVVATRSVFAGGGTDYTLTIVPEPSGAALALGTMLAAAVLRRRLGQPR